MKNGVYLDMPNQAYHDNRSHRSSSVLKTALKDPLLFYKQYVLNETVPMRFQSALDLGNYVHALVLEPHTVAEDFALWTGARKQGKEFELFKLKHQGKIVLNKGQQDMADMMYDNFRKTKVDLSNGEEVLVPHLFDGGQAEASVFTKLKGMNLKARFDYIDVERGVIIDVKTTSADVTSRDKAKQVILDLDYDLSAALYLDIAEKQYGKKFVFQWCFMQKLSSFTKVYQASADTIGVGRSKYTTAIKLIKQWEKTGKYLTNEIEVI